MALAESPPSLKLEFLRLPPSWRETTLAVLYLEGQGDLVSRLIMAIIGLIMWVIGVTNLLTKSP